MKDNAGAASYYLADGLGSTTQLVDGAGALTGDAYTYDAFGAPRSVTGTTANDFRFTGQQTDAKANRGLYYLRARHYDPALGRFLGRDPVPALQRYAYAGNDPLNRVDPSGLAPGGEPTPVPLPAAGPGELERRDACIAAFDRCIDMAHDVQREKPGFRPGSIYAYYTICTKYLGRCTGGGDKAFNLGKARREMEDLFSHHDNGFSVGDLIPRVSLPNLGTGGYLPPPNSSKEAGFRGFGCL